MDELLGYVEHWQKQMEAHWTNNGSISNEPCTTYKMQQHDVDDTTIRKSDQYFVRFGEGLSQFWIFTMIHPE